MKIKTLITLLIILTVLAAAGILIERQKGSDRSEITLGTSLLGELPVNEVVAIKTTGPKGATVTVRKKTDRWSVEDRYDYPADFEKIAEFVMTIKQMKVGRQFDASEDTLKRLALEDPEDQNIPEREMGIRIELKDKGGATLANFILGKTRETGEGATTQGQYLRLAKDATIYLVDKDFKSYRREPADWLEKLLVDVDEKEVQKISCQSLDGKGSRYIVERPEKGKDLELMNPPPGKKLKQTALNRLAGALATLRLEDVVDPAATPESLGLEIPARLEYQLFNGMIYRIYPGKTKSEAERYYLRLEVDCKEPPAGDKGAEEETASEEKAPEKEREEASEKSPEELILMAKRLNERLSSWIFEISEWKHDDFIMEMDKLLEEPEEEKEEKKPSKEL